MKTNPIKVSVVIPVYNTEKYVRAAVESIMRQTLKELEIILINDGSTDQSADILAELACTDPRISIYPQANQGQSMARNAGIAQAKGAYIYFMDSDDLLEEDALELCYLRCEKDLLDFVFFDAENFYDGITNAPPLIYKRTDKLTDQVYSGPRALEVQINRQVYTPSPCLSLIRLSFLEDHHLRFAPGIVHEDQLFTALLYLQAERTACIRRTFFQRRMRAGSIMTRKFSERNLVGYLTVTHKLLAYKRQTADVYIASLIDAYLRQMFNAMVWEAHVLPLRQRLRLAWISLFKYKRYVTFRNLAVLLFKSALSGNKQNR